MFRERKAANQEERKMRREQREAQRSLGSSASTATAELEPFLSVCFLLCLPGSPLSPANILIPPNSFTLGKRSAGGGAKEIKSEWKAKQKCMKEGQTHG